MSESNNRKAAIKKLKNLVYSTKQDLEVFRKNLENTFNAPILPNNVECTERDYAEIKCDSLMPVIYSSNRVMIYVHGGSFVGGSKKAWRGFCSTLATACSCRVIVPEYRLAPKSVFPSATEDLQAVFRAVVTEEQIACSLNSTDWKHDSMPEIIIAADGSGASMAMALVLKLKEKYRACISHVILFSPWLNLSPASPIIREKKVHDEILSGDCIRRSGDSYTYTDNLENPFVSPIFASDELLTDFPPVFIQLGEKEILVDDALSMQNRLISCDRKCEVDIWQNMMYMFQMADEFIAEAHLAIEKVGRLVTFKEDKIDEVTLTRSPFLESGLKSEA